MIAGKIKYAKTHHCEKEQAYNIPVEQHTDGRVSHWFLNFKGTLCGIQFCPYCGQDLYKD